MESVRHLIVGAGISGLAFAAFSNETDQLVIEGDSAIGGYCKTVRKDGFVWDYSGHFFHFKHPEIESWLRERMRGQSIRTVEKLSSISFKKHTIDFPFQKNIHQLPHDDFVECLHDVFVATRARESGNAPTENNFKEMLYARFGKGIAERFLIPYNEKLYACDLATLDRNAMGRFFPHANLDEIIANMKRANNSSYNATFTYPEGGAIEYVNALASEVPSTALSLNERLVHIDLRTRTATTSKRKIQFERLVSSVPFHQLVSLAGLAHDRDAFTWNRVLVFNLGFDRKGPRNVHWMYFPDRSLSFYRVGFYDNIFDTDRMSLYIEIGYPREGVVDVESQRKRVLEDLAREGIVKDHNLVAEHSVLMDPAYVHITQKSIAEHARLSRILNAHGVYSIGRYGGWTYCSIEDNIVEARSLARDFQPT